METVEYNGFVVSYAGARLLPGDPTGQYSFDDGTIISLGDLGCTLTIAETYRARMVYKITRQGKLWVATVNGELPPDWPKDGQLASGKTREGRTRQWYAEPRLKIFEPHSEHLVLITLR